MSFDEKTSYPIGGKQVQGGLPTAILNMLQFNAVTNQWEFIPTVVPPVAALGDLEFVRDEELLGDLIKLFGTRSTVGIIVSTTPATGKTFFFIVATLNTDAPNDFQRIRAQIRNNAVVREELVVGWTAAGGGFMGNDGSKQRGDSLIGNGALVYDLNLAKIDNALTTSGTMQGWIQDT